MLDTMERPEEELPKIDNEPTQEQLESKRLIAVRAAEEIDEILAPIISVSKDGYDNEAQDFATAHRFSKETIAIAEEMEHLVHAFIGGAQATYTRSNLARALERSERAKHFDNGSDEIVEQRKAERDQYDGVVANDPEARAAAWKRIEKLEAELNQCRGRAIALVESFVPEIPQARIADLNEDADISEDSEDGEASQSRVLPSPSRDRLLH